MKESGQITLEAMLAVAGLLAAVSILLSGLSMQKNWLGEFLSLEREKNSSIECAMLVDALASNGFEVVLGREINCIAGENNSVKSAAVAKTGGVKTVAAGLANNRIKGKDFLEVRVLEHYR